MRYKNSDYDIFEDGKCYSRKSKRFLKPQMTNKYPTYHLTVNGKKKKVFIHRMVAETFLPPKEGKNIVNHIDGNTKNYNLNNLEWVNEKENSQHAVDMGLLPKGNQNAIYYTQNLKDEKWTSAKGYENYLISSCGRIMNKNTKRLLKLSVSNNGYYYCNLWRNNKGTTEQVHLLVYKSFYEDYDDKKVINHIDGNKLNNCLNNLELVSYQENNLHAVYIIGTNKCAKKVAQISIDNNEIIAIFPSIAQATRETKINNISRAIQNETTAGGFKWKKLDN